MSQKKADPTDDLDEITTIKRIDKMELELVDSLLRQIEESPGTAIIQQGLFELRYLCQLRQRLLNNLRSEYLASHGAA